MRSFDPCDRSGCMRVDTPIAQVLQEGGKVVHVAKRRHHGQGGRPRHQVIFKTDR
jgi:hypothetical protein